MTSTFGHILKNCPEKWVNNRSIMYTTEISPDVLTICKLLTIVLFLRLHISKMVPLGVYRLIHALREGVGWGRGWETSMFGSLSMCSSAW